MQDGDGLSSAAVVFVTRIGGEKGYEKYAKVRMKTAAKLVLKEAEPFRYVNEVLANTGLGIRFCLVTAQNKDLVKKMLKKF